MFPVQVDPYKIPQAALEARVSKSYKAHNSHPHPPTGSVPRPVVHMMHSYDFVLLLELFCCYFEMGCHDAYVMSS